MKVAVLKMLVDVSEIEHALTLITSWLSAKRKNRYICVSNVHMCMEVFDDNNYRLIINNADLTVADGKPISWAQYLLGYKTASQIRGEVLTKELCALAQDKKYKVGFYGSTDYTLKTLNQKLIESFPSLDIAYQYSPPYRPLEKEEDKKIVEEINKSDVDILFVGLGCPKQEIWMANHVDRLNCTMLGVGAAFDFISGNKKNAPAYLQKLGLEWLFRLISEPRRLWKRYLKQNPRFIYYFTLQLLGKKYG